MKKLYKMISAFMAVFFVISTLYTGEIAHAEENKITDTPAMSMISVSSKGVVSFEIEHETSYVYDNSPDMGDGYYDDDDYWDDYDDYKSTTPDSYELYRASSEDGEYQKITSGKLDSGYGYGAKFKDTSAELGVVYYYKVRYVNDTGDVFSDYSAPVKVGVVPDPAKIKYVRATGSKTLKITWKAVSDIDGYNIYYKEVDEENLYGIHYFSQYESDGVKYYECGVGDKPYKFYKSVSAKSTSAKFNKSKHGKGYLIAIKTYKLVNGVKVESVRSYVGHGIQDYYFCPHAENKKYKLIWPKSVSQGNKWAKKMTVIKVKTWDYKNHEAHKGKKVTKTLYIQVNKKYAPTIKKIYAEIYKDKTKPPIYEAGSFRWGEDELGYYHCQGVAIDMNVNENPMFKRKNGKITKKPLVGSFYKPKTNPYSIPRNGVVENTFRKYGFYRLDHDLMHFEAHGNWGSCNYSK